jgi:hypothetical protein
MLQQGDFVRCVECHEHTSWAGTLATTLYNHAFIHACIHLGQVVLALPIPLAGKRLQGHIHQRHSSLAGQDLGAGGLARAWCGGGVRRESLECASRGLCHHACSMHINTDTWNLCVIDVQHVCAAHLEAHDPG